MKNCNECGIEVKYACKGKCNKCYQKERQLKLKLLKPVIEKIENCLICNKKEGELNTAGKSIVRRLVKGYCEICYYKTFKTKTIRTCKNCGIEFKKMKVSGLCVNCKKDVNKKFNVDKKIPRRWDLEPQLYQDMLTLFRRYRDGMTDPVDAFRVVDVYLRVFEGYPFVYNSQIDTYSEENQIILMLKNMKRVYDNI